MKVEFWAGSQVVQDTVPMPAPSQKFIPDWYKQVPPIRGHDGNIKACMPFLDALTNGYIQETWADILIEDSPEGVRVSSNHELQIVGWRERNDLPEIEGYEHTQFIWQKRWAPIFPDNFSGLITHPLNRIDLPFYTFSGIVEFDRFNHEPVGNLPFYLKKNFRGIIPKGTPMFQIIPLARADWEASMKSYNEAEWQQRKADKVAESEFYKRKIWQKKSFKGV
jgi:hypothetical protein